MARAIFDGVKNAEKDILPDPLSAPVAQSWRSRAAKAFELQIAALHHTAPVAAPAT